MTTTVSRHRWRSAGLATLYVVAALAPLSIGLVRPGLTSSGRLLPEDMVYGQAHRPFVKRQLVPLVVRGVAAVIPAAPRARFGDWFEATALGRRLGWPAPFAVEYSLLVGLMYASLLGFLVQLRRFLVQCLEISPAVSHAAALLVGLGLPSWFKALFPVYDFAQLFLFTTALGLMLRGRWWALYGVFVIACVNKEMSILLPVVLAAWLGRRCLAPRFATYVGSQLVVGCAIAAGLAWIFRDNPGGNFEWHLPHNLTLSWNALGWFRLGLLVGIVALVLSRIGAASRFLRRGFVVTLLPLFSLTLLFGWIDELRAYYEALPFAVALGLVAIGLPRATAGPPAGAGHPVSRDPMTGAATARDDIRTVIRAYDDVVVRAYCWARFRILHQRFLREIGQYLPDSGFVLDLGCGFGLFSLYYARRRPALEILGLDLSGRRIEIARAAARKLSVTNVRYEVGDASALALSRRLDAAYMLDIVHHIPRTSVAPLMDHLAARLEPGRRLIVKDVDREPRYKRWFTYGLDKLMDFRAEIDYWGNDELTRLLDRSGFEVHSHAMVDLLPYPHMLYVCTKRSGSDETHG